MFNGMEIFRVFGSVFIKDDEAQKGLDNINRKAKQSGEEADKSGLKWWSFGKVVAGAVLGVATAVGVLAVPLAKMGVQYNAMMEQSQIAWETILGDVDKAKDTIKELQIMGAKTPFEFEGLDKSAKLLSMAKFEGQGLYDALTSVGDAVAGIGGSQETLEGVSMALFQMQAKGKVQAEEMMQLAERGLPVWDLLAEKMGKSTQELMDMSSKGQLLANETVPLLVEAMGERFAGAMDKQSQTWNGMISTLKDNFQLLLAQVTSPLFEKLKEMLPYIIDKVNDISDAFAENGWEGVFKELLPEPVYNFLKEALTDIKTLVKDTADSVMENTREIREFWDENGAQIVSGVTHAWNEVYKVVSFVLYMLRGTIGSFFTAVLGTMEVFIGLFTGNWDKVLNGTKKSWDAFGTFLKTIWVGAWAFLLETLDGMGIKIEDWFENLPDKAFQWGKNMIQGFVDGMKWMINEVKAGANLMGDFMGEIADYIGFNSPAKKGEGRNIVKWGANMVEGFTDGVRSKIPMVADTMNGMVTDAKPTQTITNTTTTPQNIVIQVQIDPKNIQEMNDVTDFFRVLKPVARQMGVNI